MSTQAFVQKLNPGLFFKYFEELNSQLRDKEMMAAIHKNVWEKRMQFSFDYHIDKLTDFFTKVISEKQSDTMLIYFEGHSGAV